MYYPAVCLIPFLTNILECAPLNLIFLEDPWVVSFLTIIIIIILGDQTGHPRKSPRTIRLRRVPRGKSMIIRKIRTKTKKKKSITPKTKIIKK